ncbi:hypothetical protein BS78_03G224600 [Paspalum vaginatum]|nr:hypothetical protein BS78_03G224600 [Paspalum vaginatum]
MLYPLVPAPKTKRWKPEPLAPRPPSSRLPSSLSPSSTTLLLLLKKASRAYKYAPLPPGAKFLSPDPLPPLHPPIALRSPTAAGDRSSPSTLPPARDSRGEARRHPPQIPPTEVRPACSLSPPPRRSDRVLPEVEVMIRHSF